MSKPNGVNAPAALDQRYRNARILLAEIAFLAQRMMKLSAAHRAAKAKQREHRAGRCVPASPKCRMRFEVSATMTATKSEIRDGMQIDWDAPIAIDDGIILRADVFRPVEKAAPQDVIPQEGCWRVQRDVHRPGAPAVFIELPGRQRRIVVDARDLIAQIAERVVLEVVRQSPRRAVN